MLMALRAIRRWSFSPELYDTIWLLHVYCLAQKQEKQTIASERNPHTLRILGRTLECCSRNSSKSEWSITQCTLENHVHLVDGCRYSANDHAIRNASVVSFYLTRVRKTRSQQIAPYTMQAMILFVGHVCRKCIFRSRVSRDMCNGKVRREWSTMALQSTSL